ncbi:DedA family protein [Thermoactinomyces sp. DSM 45892]|uniref:DedA family protein n=1 Tax=Thermoactinomyces sp. DSM 45892 TaxID=1882753 RepID=UPI00089856EC|nr:DedA family protein [Thermoactinomyces sp. DSM 45892]SDY02437.1 membrane protein DedA, SNARE-associated domain [Thermoactinomyces sp. DSM 45892]
MEVWIMDFIEALGDIGIFLLVALENVSPPIPYVTVVTLSGFMVTETSLTFTDVIIASTLGSVVGGSILYYIGNMLEISSLERIVDRYGRVFMLKKEDVCRGLNWFRRCGTWVIFFCRMLPFLRSFISIFAGVSGMKFGRFLLFTTLGSLIWNSALLILGFALGLEWGLVIGYLKIYNQALLVLTYLLGALFLIWYARRAWRLIVN